MNTSNDVRAVNEQVIKLWQKEFRDPKQARCPLLYSDLEPDGILFIGCNPALPKRNHYKVPTLADVLAAEGHLSDLIEQESNARKCYPYYRPCHDIAKRLKMPWAHVDWFFQRGTSQRELENELSESPAGWDEPVELSRFAREQMLLARKLMEACRPRMALVANGFASKIAKGEFGLGKLDERGFLWGEISGRKIPFFLSGMLTGQRALDRGSRERLEWHMEQAKQFIEGGHA